MVSIELGQSTNNQRPLGNIQLLAFRTHIKALRAPKAGWLEIHGGLHKISKFILERYIILNQLFIALPKLECIVIISLSNEK